MIVVQERMKRISALKSFKRPEIFQKRAYTATCGDYAGIHALRFRIKFAPLMFAVCI